MADYEAIIQPLLPTLSKVIDDAGGVQWGSTLFADQRVKDELAKLPEDASRKVKDVIACFPNFFTYFDKQNIVANAKGYEHGFIGDDGELDLEKIKDYRLEMKKNKLKAKGVPVDTFKVEVQEKKKKKINVLSQDFENKIEKEAKVSTSGGFDSIKEIRQKCLALSDDEWALLVSTVTTTRLNRKKQRALASNKGTGKGVTKFTTIPNTRPSGIPSKGKGTDTQAKGKGKGKGKEKGSKQRAAPF